MSLAWKSKKREEKILVTFQKIEKQRQKNLIRRDGQIKLDMTFSKLISIISNQGGKNLCVRLQNNQCRNEPKYNSLKCCSQGEFGGTLHEYLPSLLLHTSSAVHSFDTSSCFADLHYLVSVGYQLWRVKHIRYCCGLGVVWEDVAPIILKKNAEYRRQQSDDVPNKKDCNWDDKINEQTNKQTNKLIDK